MMDSIMILQMCIGVGMCIEVGIIFFFISQSRRSQYKKIAEKLKANYVSGGLFMTDKIIGTINGKEFTIQNIQTGHLKYSTVITHISINCNNLGIVLVFQSKFFKNFPNWKAVFIVDKVYREEGIFFTSTIKDKLFPLKEKYKHQVYNIFQRINVTYNNFIRKGNIIIDKSSVIFVTTPNIMKIKNYGKIKKIIEILYHITQNIEDKPIMRQCK